MSQDQATLSPPPILVPPLRDGDRLTRAEFERRYDAMPELHKAELIDGVVHMSSPVRFEKHAEPHYTLGWWLPNYGLQTPGTRGGDNGTVRLDVINEPQPDLFLLIDPRCGGQARISADDYIEHAPELTVEIAASSADIDLGQKKQTYLRTGVCEYVVWCVKDGVLHWFALQGETYQPLVPGADGVLRSEVFPGLWLDASALLSGDLVRFMRVAAAGIASPEHAAFVQLLQSRRSS